MKQHAEATTRNREPIVEVLRRLWTTPRTVLEVASGTGQHAVHFAAMLPHLDWQPTDASPAALASIEAWRAEAGLRNLRPARPLDVTGPWPTLDFDAVFCANMIHIAPPEAGSSLLREAGARLPEGGELVLYGPFRRQGRHTAPSNEAFDGWLKAQDARFGVRDLDELVAEARTRGLRLVEEVTMPANNLTVVFAKIGASPGEQRRQS